MSYSKFPHLFSFYVLYNSYPFKKTSPVSFCAWPFVLHVGICCHCSEVKVSRIFIQEHFFVEI